MHCGGVMAILQGGTDVCNLNTETVLGNGLMASCFRVKYQIVPNIPERRLPLHLCKGPCILSHCMDENRWVYGAYTCV
eukprot:4212731-Pyramimonas_sp.AAC.1